MTNDSVIEAYSRRAEAYAASGNQESCWGKASRALWSRLVVPPGSRTIVDVGCGYGATLAHLAAEATPGTRFIGVEPAEGMRVLAREVTANLASVELRDGRFEALPLQDTSVDYLYSIMAFHWVTDPAIGAREISEPGAESNGFADCEGGRRDA